MHEWGREVGVIRREGRGFLKEARERPSSQASNKTKSIDHLLFQLPVLTNKYIHARASSFFHINKSIIMSEKREREKGVGTREN